jgi:hypothetical protein
MAHKTAAIVSCICLFAGQLLFAPSSSAHPAECYPGPDFQAYQGARWEYRRDPTSSQGCWYLKQLDTVSRRSAGKLTQPSPAVPAPSSGSVTSWGTPASDKGEVRPAKPSQTFSAWFWSGFESLSNSRQAYTTVSQGEAAMGEPSLTPERRRDDERPVSKKPQRSKIEQQSKEAQPRSEVKGRASRVPDRYGMYAVSLLEAAGDKPVANMPVLVGQVLKKAIEAVGDKDVVTATTATTDLKDDWQKALYEEFLRWRANQLMSP